MAGAMALAWLWAGTSSAQTSQKPAFARLAVSENSVVYIQIEGGELRAAMSAEGLQTAAPVRMTAESAYVIASPEFTLPIPAERLPAGVTAIKATLTLMQIPPSTLRSEWPPRISGRFRIFRTDDRKVEWQYASSGEVLTGANAEEAPSIMLPNLDKVNARLAAAVSGGTLRVNLGVNAGGALLAGVRKAGHMVQVKMVVTDASGAVIASKVGTLSDFGFS
jgi:hypothetical protein